MEFIWHPTLGFAKPGTSDLSPNPFSDRDGEFATVIAEWRDGVVSRVLLAECTLGFSV